MSLPGLSSGNGEGERRGLWSNLRCSRSVAFRNERRHLIFLSVLAGVVFFGCGVLGATSRYSAPKASLDTATTGSGGASSAATGGQQVPGSQQQQQHQQNQQQRLATVAGAAGLGSSTSSSGGGDADSSDDLKVHVYNAYTAGNPLDLYPWEHMAEPYKPSTMEVLGWPQSGDNLEYR